MTNKTLQMVLGMACLGLIANAPVAHAQTVFTNRVAFDSAFPGASQENWDEFHAGHIIDNGSTVNGITYTTDGPNVIVNPLLPTTTHPNGIGEVPLGVFGGFADQITFTFSQPITAFSIDIDTLAHNTGAYTATLSNGVVVDSSYDPFGKLEPTWEFIGVSDPGDPFTSVTIDDPSFLPYSLDTLQYVDAPVSAVPEPPTMALMLVGMAAAFGLNGRRKLALVVRK